MKDYQKKLFNLMLSDCRLVIPCGRRSGKSFVDQQMMAISRALDLQAQDEIREMLRSRGQL
jgi:hypothetical protein